MGVVLSLTAPFLRTARLGDIGEKSKRGRKETRRPAPSTSLPTSPAASGPAEGAPLRSLGDAALAARFQQWRGASGRRYVCSVFPVLAGESLGGLPEFDKAVVVAVARGTSGKTRRVGLFASRWRAGAFCGDAAAVAAALAAGADEWHVHLIAGGGRDVGRALADLAP